MTNILRKMKSIKTWVLLFICILLGFIVFTKTTEFRELAMMLAGVVISYFGFNVWQKKIFDGGKNNETSL